MSDIIFKYSKKGITGKKIVPNSVLEMLFFKFGMEQKLNFNVDLCIDLFINIILYITF